MKTTEFEKASMFLNALQEGFNVKIEDTMYGMDNGSLVLKIPAGKSGDEFVNFCRNEIRFSEFLQLARQMNDDQYDLLKNGIIMAKYLLGDNNKMHQKKILEANVI